MELGVVLLLLEGSSYEVIEVGSGIFRGVFVTRTQKFGMTWKKRKYLDGNQYHYLWEFLFGDLQKRGSVDEEFDYINFEPTGNGEQSIVLSRCLAFCEEFKRRYDPDVVGCLYERRSQGKLYSRLMKKLWPNFEFDVVQDDDFMLLRGKAFGADFQMHRVEDDD